MALGILPLTLSKPFLLKITFILFPPFFHTAAPGASLRKTCSQRQTFVLLDFSINRRKGRLYQVPIMGSRRKVPCCMNHQPPTTSYQWFDTDPKFLCYLSETTVFYLTQRRGDFVGYDSFPNDVRFPYRVKDRTIPSGSFIPLFHLKSRCFRPFLLRLCVRHSTEGQLLFWTREVISKPRNTRNSRVAKLVFFRVFRVFRG